MKVNRDELVDCIMRALPEDGKVEPLEGLILRRSSVPTEPLHTVSGPCLCVIAQGSKEVHLGEHSYQYDPYHYLLVTADLPIVGNVIEASKQRPYLSLRLDLDPNVVSSVMVEAAHAATAGFRVGYNDASHFSREYKRLFGKPPMRDVEQLREVAAHNGGLGAD